MNKRTKQTQTKWELVMHEQTKANNKVKENVNSHRNKLKT